LPLPRGSSFFIKRNFRTSVAAQRVPVESRPFRHLPFKDVAPTLGH